jgi:hypothetical protein
MRIEITKTEVIIEQRGDRIYRSQEAHAFVQGDKYPKTISLPIPEERGGMAYPIGEFDLSYDCAINRWGRPQPTLRLDPVAAKAAGPKVVNN